MNSVSSNQSKVSVQLSLFDANMDFIIGIIRILLLLIYNADKNRGYSYA